MCQLGERKELAKDLCISDETFCRWKKEFGLPVNSQFKHSDSEKSELIRKYYNIKRRNSRNSDRDIANILNIGYSTLRKWRKRFGLILNQNSVDEHSLPENGSSFADKDTSEHSVPSSDDNLWAWNLAKKKRTERIEMEHSVKK
uniref:Transposase n=1 Tax=Globodera rostochiensis TaxID=31243 RepID=A0A914H8T6_GLORO